MNGAILRGFLQRAKNPAGPRVLKHKRAAVCTRGVICFHPFRFMAGIYKETNPFIHKCVMYLAERADVKSPTWTRVHVGNKAPIFAEDKHYALWQKWNFAIGSWLFSFRFRFHERRASVSNISIKGIFVKRHASRLYRKFMQIESEQRKRIEIAWKLKDMYKTQMYFKKKYEHVRARLRD